MRILGGKLSPFVMRCVLAARLKGKELPVEMPAGGLKSADYLALNPMGKMPVLVNADFAIPESAVIVEYLDEVLDGPKLLPEAPEARAMVRLLARMGELYLMPGLSPIFNARANPDGVAEGVAKMADALRCLEAMRPAHMRCMAGDEPTLADATLMPIFFFLDAFDRPFGTARLLEATPGLAAWWADRKATGLGAQMMEEMGAALAAFMAPKPA